MTAAWLATVGLRIVATTGELTRVIRNLYYMHCVGVLCTQYVKKSLTNADPTQFLYMYNCTVAMQLTIITSGTVYKSRIIPAPASSGTRH